MDSGKFEGADFKSDVCHLVSVEHFLERHIFSSLKDHAVYANFRHGIGGIGMRKEKDFPPVEAEELPWEFE